MKKFITVTEFNITAMYGYLKKFFNDDISEMVSQNVYVNTYNNAKRLLHTHNNNWEYVEIDGQIMMSVKDFHGLDNKRFELIKYTSKYSVIPSYIAIRNTTGYGRIINVGDKIRISHNTVFVKKTKSCLRKGHHFEVLQVKRHSSYSPPVYYWDRIKEEKEREIYRERNYHKLG